MPKSATISLIAALLAVLLYACLDYWTWHAEQTSDILSSRVRWLPDSKVYVEIAIGTFNAVAVVCLGILFYRNEKSSHAAFGAVVRNNLSTIIFALLIALIQSFIEIITIFFSI